MNVNEDHFYFTSNNHSLYGVLYEPNIINQYSENYLILHPFAEEKKSSQKVLVDLARRLNENGNRVLLFDFYGCGDSEGELTDANFSIWLEDIKQSAIFLRKKTNIKDVNIIGLRLGAFLGCIYAINDGEIGKLILLEPVIDPTKDLLRSLRSKLMKELCTDGEITSNRDDLLVNLNNNISVDFSGHEICSKFYKDLLSYDGFNPYKALAKRGNDTLFINISQTGRLTRQLQKLLSEINIENTIENKLINLEPFWGQIDLPDCSDLIAEIVDWCALKGDRRPETGCRIREEAKNHKQSPNSQSSMLIAQIPNPDFKESVLTIQNEKDKIFGILTEPNKPAIKGVTIVFLHGWSGYRIGPHRMIVDYARKLAGLGFHCVRFDFRGKGFSPLDKKSDNKTQLSDLECILNNLHQFDLPDKLILTGICSGARLALYYALKGEKLIDGVIELSTPFLQPENQVQVELSRTKSLFREYFKKAFRKETWLKIFNNELRFRLIFRIIKNPIKNSLQFLFIKKYQARKIDPSKHNNTFLIFKGEILAIHGEKDPETEVALKQVVNLTSKYAIPLEKHIIKEANHSFYSIVWKDEIFDIIQNWLLNKYPIKVNEKQS